MIVIIVVLVIALFLFWWRDDPVLGTIFAGILLLVCGGASIGGAALYADHHPSPVREQTYDLAALTMGSTTSGSFFLGIGTVNSEPMYFYYYKTDDGGLQMDYTNADLTVVKQDATPETSYITYYCQDYKVHSFWSWPIHPPKWSYCFNYVNEIHIPPGSIDTDFNASLPS